MTSLGFVVRLAWREARAARRRLALLTASVMAGVGALVAVNSFTDNMTVSVAEQAQSLLGADLSLSGRHPPGHTAVAKRLIDSLRQLGGGTVRTAAEADLGAMAYTTTSGGARLVQLNTVDPGWPFYGSVTTEPANIWPDLQQGGAIVDPSLLSAIDAHVGDTLALGEARFPILGTLTNFPGDVGLQTVFGARVFIATRALESTKLTGFGARIDWTTYIKLPPGVNAQAIAKANRPALQAMRVNIRSVADDRDALTRGLTRLGNYLGLVALAALLLGGLGVASAVHVFIRQQLDSIAVLRCLGASSTQIIGVYLLQSLAMGLLGSVLGAFVGVGLQQLMPIVLADFIPVNVHVVASPRALLIGIGLGLWTATIFAMLPLVRIRDISPLATLRRDVNPGGPRWDTLRAIAVLAMVVSVVALAALQIGSLAQGAWFAAGTAGALAVLWLAALALAAIARRWTPDALPYLWRQGLANLHRPANQTVTVVIALGFGAFLLTTLFTAQSNLLTTLRFESGGTQKNLVLFDIQPDQQTLVDSALRVGQITPESYTPIVPMRMLVIKRDSVATLLRRAAAAGDSADSVDSARPEQRGRNAGPPAWTLRREYRSTYRAEKLPAEILTAGKWFAKGDTGSGGTPSNPVAISMEDGLASQLGVKVGDPIVWDVQGATIYSRITSLRKLNWARFEPNFFVVFAPGAIDRAPQSAVTLVSAPDASQRGQVQRYLAEHAANVTSIDLGEVAKSLQTLVDRIVLAIRFMALFSLATGAVVLVGAIATSRWQRVREGTLLRTLGATRGQVLVILCVEYAALGLGAAIVASGLAGVAGWAIAKWYFDASFSLPVLPVFLLAFGLVTLTTLVGLLNSLEVLRRPPLEVLRAE